MSRSTAQKTSAKEGTTGDLGRVYAVVKTEG